MNSKRNEIDNMNNDERYIVWMRFNNMEGIIDQMMKFDNVDEIKIYG